MMCQVLFSLSLFSLLLCTVRGGVIADDAALPAEKSNDPRTIIDVQSCSALSRNREEIGCSQVQEATGYSLSIDALNFEPGEFINVKVYRTKCPVADVSSPTKWYHLEAFWGNKSNLTTPPGKLTPLFHRADIYSCHDDTKMLFYPCEPNLYDFPGKFAWTSPNSDSHLIDPICFRLTVFEENNAACEAIEKCIPPSKQSGTESGSVYFDSVNEDAPDYEYTDDHDDLLTDRSYVRVNVDLDSKQQPAPTCKENQELNKSFGSPWIPHCDCDGYFHPVQCYTEPGSHTVTCWCSSQFGAEVSRTRVTMECDDAEAATVFELSCVTDVKARTSP